MMINHRIMVGALLVVAAGLLPVTSQAAAKHRRAEKSPASHARREHAAHGGTKRRGQTETTKVRSEAAQPELSEIEKRWNLENVEPELPEQ